MPTYLLNAGIETEKLEAVEKELKVVLPGLARIQGIKEIEKYLSPTLKEPIFVLVVAPSADSENFERLIGVIARFRGKIFFILVSKEISATAYKRLVQAGGADWVSETANRSEILEIIERQKSKGEAAPTSAHAARPVVVSFLASAGGVGNATIAVETAVQLKKGGAGKARRVALIDLDFQLSHVCDYLDIEPQLQIRDIAENPARLDNQLFDIFVSRHSSDVHVFAAPRSKFPPWTVDLAALDRLFEIIAARYNFIVIALPAHWFPWTAHVVSASSAVVVTGVNTVPGLRMIAEALAEVRKVAGGTIETRVALNRCEFGMFGGVRRSDHVGRVLRGEKILYVGNTELAVNSVNVGVPMSLGSPSQKIAKQIGRIASYCASVKTAHSASA